MKNKARVQKMVDNLTDTQLVYILEQMGYSKVNRSRKKMISIVMTDWEDGIISDSAIESLGKEN